MAQIIQINKNIPASQLSNLNDKIDAEKNSGIEANDVLKYARNKLSSCMVIGIKKSDNSLYTASSTSDAAIMNLMLDLSKSRLLSIVLETDDELSDEDTCSDISNSIDPLYDQDELDIFSDEFDDMYEKEIDINSIHGFENEYEKRFCQESFSINTNIISTDSINPTNDTNKNHRDL